VTPSLAAVILTKNEERHIGECLDSLDWADDRVVFDDFSSDHTAEVAREHGARVLEHRFEDFAAQRNAALDNVKATWILFVDADERATTPLAEEIGRVITRHGDDAPAGWWVPRHNYMLGHRMCGGGWFPDYQLRLLRHGRAHYDPGRPVHEVVILDGEAGYLKEVLVHYNYDSVGQFRRKMGRYTAYEARILLERGVRVQPWTYATMPVREFWRRFVSLRGYRDHVYGLLFCGLMAWYTLTTYRLLNGLRQTESA
jgi:glycosyltransferase involved in cell wall biosynthesis